MRPKKSILLYCANETYASQMRFKLNVWAYDVESASTEDELREAFAGRAFDLVLFVPSDRKESALIDQFQQLQAITGNTLRVLDKFNAFAGDDAIPFTLIPLDSWLVREGIRMAVARKRGPRSACVQMNDKPIMRKVLPERRSKACSHIGPPSQRSVYADDPLIPRQRGKGIGLARASALEREGALPGFIPVTPAESLGKEKKLCAVNVGRYALSVPHILDAGIPGDILNERH